MSVSLRTANLDDHPFDFELSGGMENKYSKSSYLYERENDKYYYGGSIDYDFRYIKFKHYKKTAKNIDRQKLSVLYPVKDFSFGFSYGTNRWKYGKYMITAQYVNDYIDIDYSVGKKTQSLEIVCKYKKKIRERLAIIPMIVLKKFDDTMFWQTKLVFEMIQLK